MEGTRHLYGELASVRWGLYALTRLTSHKRAQLPPVGVRTGPAHAKFDL